LGNIFAYLVISLLNLVKGKLFVVHLIMFHLKSLLEIFMMKKLMYGVLEFFAMSFVQVNIIIILGKAPFESKTD